jgi:putative SOS response-associated peptidase YedK
MSDAPRYNGAPGQDHWVIRQHPKAGERTLDRLWWGLIPYWIKDTAPKHRPINATAERVATAPMFRAAYGKRRCLLPVDNFFEWRATKGARAKQPFAIGMKSGEPFALGAIWDNWRGPGSEEWVRTFAVITTTANDLVAQIHDRMPVIIPPESYDRWSATSSRTRVICWRPTRRSR